MSIRIITDSASDLSWDFAREHGIKIIPLSIIIHDEEYKEDEKFDYDAYYKLFEEEKAYFNIPKLKLYSFVPKTSQPAPKDFLDAYQELFDEGAKEIIVITVTEGLSGTINSSRLAEKLYKRQKKDAKIFIVDAKSASYPEVYLVKMALKLIDKGLSGEEIAKILQEQALNIKTVILLPTLRYLWKGGRLATSKFILGTILRKKPIVKTDSEGKVGVVAAVKSVEEGLMETLKISTDDFTKKPKLFTIVYGARPDYAEILKGYIEEKFPEVQVNIARSGASVLSHLGPDSIGLISDFTEDV
ncbi:MAG: DegV family protein [Candidatus Heimdallarchaeaceae archaeon]